MRIHGRAKLGPAGRLTLCEAIESGMTFRQAVACLKVSPATAHRWWHRRAKRRNSRDNASPANATEIRGQCTS